MVFPVVTPSNPRGQWFEQTLIYIISKSFHVNMSSSGSIVLEKTMKYPSPFLYFCDYLPFEEDLALHWNKREFPSPKDNFYQVWLNLAGWFWRRIFLFKFFIVFLLFCYYLLLEKGYPLYLNPLPPRTIFAKSC
jgi:hypothetical protein